MSPFPKCEIPDCDYPVEGDLAFWYWDDMPPPMRPFAYGGSHGPTGRYSRELAVCLNHATRLDKAGYTWFPYFQGTKFPW